MLGLLAFAAFCVCAGGSFTFAIYTRFMQDIESGKSSPLCTATSGYHYHLIAADSEETLETIGRALADEGYLAPLLPHEQG